jgi:membrane carboxypeptidase/penicillin-binding protein PbpC
MDQLQSSVQAASFDASRHDLQVADAVTLKDMPHMPDHVNPQTFAGCAAATRASIDFDRPLKSQASEV